MTPPGLAILNTGLVTSVGLNTAAACAAIRAGVSNASETHFLDSSGEPLRAHRVPLQDNWVGTTRLVQMATLAAHEALTGVPREQWHTLPLLLCTAEADRHDRPNFDGTLFAAIERQLGEEFATGSATIPQGRVSVALALERARELIAAGTATGVLIVAVDSLLNAAVVERLEQAGRLLTGLNSDGFIPGEAAGAALIGTPAAGSHMLCVGLGFATEPAPLESGRPLRAQGLSEAIRAALSEGGRPLHEVDLRITDLSGEQYYFKEAALALSRLLRVRREQIDLWHPAECIGEVGAAAGIAVLAVARMAFSKSYVPGPLQAAGPLVLAHFASDDGRRAAVLLEGVTPQ